MSEPVKHIYRSRTNYKLGGVCGGLGEYLGVDPTIVRLLYILVILFSAGFGVIAYLLMWVVMPEAPELNAKSTQKPKNPPSSDRTDA